MKDMLNPLMDFDHVVRVHEDGTVTDELNVYAPVATVTLDVDGQLSFKSEAEWIQELERQGWGLLSGYTGQYGYRGPIMHPSEYIGGRMERDILANPGLYVALIVDSDDGTGIGWAVAYREE